MALSSGYRLGQYEVLALLGAGGMGEVYRARDTKLVRDVALKVLPEVFALDPERLARFKREAQVLASLNHPHIASIYGIEESHGSSALVLELVEGMTLADRLVHGPLPLEDASSIARQIAEALEAAHDHGIVHRDLKPANIKLRGDGTVKVLDFGLAKAFDSTAMAPDASQLPTLTSPAATGIGVIMGTAAYMSPEQARGKTVDKRADVWAFGCVLYEMLAGKRPFEGDDVSQTLARVIEREPDWNALSEVAPTSVVQVVRRCLEKDPSNRLRDIGDARLELRDALAVPREVGVTPPPARLGRRALVSMIAILAAGILLGILGSRWLPLLAPGGGRVERLTGDPRLSTEINLPDDAPLALDSEAANVGYDSTLLDISPDGRTLVYVGSSGGTVRLYVRQLDTFEVRPLAGTEGALHPFFSPDGRSVGFLTDDKVKTYSLTSGTATTICDASVPVIGTWTADDQLFFGAEEGRRLFRVSAHGGTPVLVADIRDGYRYGRVTPDGTYVLAISRTGGIAADFAQIQLVNLATREAKTLTNDGYDARLTAGGDLVFGRSGRVFVARFDPARLTVGDPVPVASGVRMHAVYPHLQLAVSATGVLVYVPGGDVAVAGIAWVDRQGHAEFLAIEPRVYGMLDLSDDGRRLAVHVSDNNDYILIYDVERNSSRRLPTPESAGWPKWSPNGDALAYTSFAPGKPYRILVQSVDSDRPPRVVAESSNRLTPTTWSADQRLTYYELLSNRISSVFLPRDGAAPPSAPQPMTFPATVHDITADGRWLAYAGADNGIHVRPLPADERVQKIADVGTEPKWCRKCGELLFRRGNRWFSTEVRLSPAFEWKQPRQILQTQFNDSPGPSWALSPDGRRILVAKRKEEPPRTRLHVVHGALSGVKRWRGEHPTSVMSSWSRR
jgi:serine/threonine-protein kinase